MSQDLEIQAGGLLHFNEANTADVDTYTARIDSLGQATRAFFVLDTAGVNTWTGQLDSGHSDGSDVIPFTVPQGYKVVAYSFTFNGAPAINSGTMFDLSNTFGTFDDNRKLQNFTETTKALDPGQYTALVGNGVVVGNYTFSVTLQAVSTPPSLSVTGGSASFTENGLPASLFTGASASTNDAGQTFSGIQLTVNNVSDGVDEVLKLGGTDVTLNAHSGTLSNGGQFAVTLSGQTATVTVSGLLLDDNSMSGLIDSILYSNTNHNPTAGARTIAVTQITDSGIGNNTTSLNAAATVTVTAVNDAPAITAPDSVTVMRDAANTLTGFGFSDVDAGNGMLTATLSVDQGTLSATAGGGVTVSGSGTATLTLNGTLSALNSFVSAGHVGYATAAHGTGSVNLTTTLHDNGNTGAGGDLGAIATTTLQIQPVPPNVTGVSTGTADGAYKAGTVILIDVAFDQGIVVDTSRGAPSLSLSDGATAIFQNASGNAITFSYAVLPGDQSAGLDYSSIGALSLNGATIRNVEGDDAHVTLSAPGAAGSLSNAHHISVDTAEPTLVSGTAPAAGPHGLGASLDFSIKYSEAVLVTGAPRLALQLDNGNTVYADYASGNGTDTLNFHYSVATGAGTSHGLTVSGLTGGTIADAAGNTAQAGTPSFGDTSQVSIDAVPPTAISAASPSAGAYGLGTALDFTVGYSEAVTITGSPRLALQLENGNTVYATYLSGNGSQQLTFRYTVDTATGNSHGITVNGLSGGTITDGSGNAAAGNLPTFGNTSSVDLDGVAPTGVSATVPADGQYGIGTKLNFTVSYSEAITVTGAPKLALHLQDGSTVYASYVSGSGSDALTFTYEVGTSTGTSNGVTVGGISGGTITDGAGNVVQGPLPAFADTSHVNLDGDAPRAVSGTAPDDGLRGIGAGLDFTVSYSETVTVSGTPQLALQLESGDTVYASYVSGSGSDLLTFHYDVGAGSGNSHGITVGTVSGGSITDAAGNQATIDMPAFGDTSHIELDGVAPALKSATPGTHSSNVAVTAALVLTFSEVVSAGTGSITLHPSSGANIVIDINDASQVKFSGNTVTLTLASPLDPGITYQILINNGAIVDHAGNGFAGLAGNALDFTTLLPPPPPTLVDGVAITTDTTTNADGTTTVTVTVPVISDTRHDDTGTPNAADIPLVGSADHPQLLAQVPVGVGLTSSGSDSLPAHDALNSLASQLHSLGTDASAILGAAQSYLGSLSGDTPVLIRVLTPTVTPGTSPTATLVLHGDPGSDGITALVLDLRQLPPGVHIELDDVGFAAVIGAATVTAGSGSQVIVGDSSDQTLIAGTGKSVLHAGGGQDTAAFQGNASQYIIDQHNGYVVITSRADPSQSTMVVNAETLSFADGNIEVQNRTDLTALASLYQQVFGRQADMYGFDYWGQQQSGGTSLGHIALSMLKSPEAAAAGWHLTGDATADVNVLYHALLGRAPDAVGAAWWVAQLHAGDTLEHVASSFIASAEMHRLYVAPTGWDFVL